MKEINDIISAYHLATFENIRMALATVVKVEGSSYRQPGARMLVTEDGKLTGAISGGCLEGDALRKALLAIHQQQNKLITYDTSDEGNTEFGVQLGCNGIVHILFEYIDPADPGNPIALLQQLENSRQEMVIVTLFSLEHRDKQPGTVLIADAEGKNIALNKGYHTKDIVQYALSAKERKESFLAKVEQDGALCEALIEYRPPLVALYIIGAGNDVKPLVELADILGWETTVIDGRATHALPQRFPKAKKVILATPEQAITEIHCDPFTVFVLMTHNYHYDLALLKFLISTETRYIGSLGPKKKLQRMLDEMETEGSMVTEEQKAKIFGPVGLDIGAETSEEIALSIISEIKAVLSKRQGGSLRFLTTKIHHEIRNIS
ncbi:XdhC family protein [Sphingobacterium sp.]|uniref:XdhC family protein n=1 Tax=Sphingobacterium sp. TaxID=341027 RepID=UPI0028A0CCD7|nr:XdhC family protein [Sphingobacterium sp.]